MTLRYVIMACVLAVFAKAGAADPDLWRSEWPNTKFEKSTVASWAEIMSGGPPKDGIPALDGPEFRSAADAWDIEAREPVITVLLDGEPARAYPIRYLMWHEIVNDQIGDVPVAVTFCPLCNSGITFDRRVNGQVLSFGVTGKLRASDMVMYDRETESWWQQATGEGIVGDLTGETLTTLPTWMEDFAAFKRAQPAGMVMKEPSYNRDYGRNPYRSYDSSRRPFLYAGEMPPHGIEPLARVVRVGDRAWPLARVAENQSLTEEGLTLTWRAGQASALDTTRIGEGRDVGSIRVRNAGGEDVFHDVMFAFAFHAFWPDGQWMLAP